MWEGEDIREEGIPRALIEEEPQKQMGELKNIVKYKFFRKPMADPIPNRANNSIPPQTKVTTATQEILRRIKNTSRWNPPEVIEEILLMYMGELELGGYPYSWRRMVPESAIKGYCNIRQKEINGTGWINRPDSSRVTK